MVFHYNPKLDLLKPSKEAAILNALFAQTFYFPIYTLIKVREDYAREFRQQVGRNQENPLSCKPENSRN